MCVWNGGGADLFFDIQVLQSQSGDGLNAEGVSSASTASTSMSLPAPPQVQQIVSPPRKEEIGTSSRQVSNEIRTQGPAVFQRQDFGVQAGPPLVKPGGDHPVNTHNAGVEEDGMVVVFLDGVFFLFAGILSLCGR